MSDRRRRIWIAASGSRSPARVPGLVPEFPFRVGNPVVGTAERALAVLTSDPADVVGMEVRDEHRVDVVGVEVQAGEIVE
jgi:hypothetical protein